MKNGEIYKNYFANRELSFLNFNKRVLEESTDLSVPLLERFKFISIFHSNLDEFYMIRVGSLYEKSLLEDERLNDDKTGWSPEKQLKEIYRMTKGLYSEAGKMFWDVVFCLEKNNIKYCKYEHLEPGAKKWLKNYFKREIMPLLSAQIIDSKHPFPHLLNKQVYIILELTHNGKNVFGIISQNKNIERIIKIPKKNEKEKEKENENEYRYILSEDVIYRYANDMFKKRKMESKFIIRITRNADIDLEESFFDYEAGNPNIDYRSYMNEILKKRGKLAPVRLEVNDIRKKRLNALKKYFCQKLNISEDQVFTSDAPLDQSFIFNLKDKIEQANPKIISENMLYCPINPVLPEKVDGSKPVFKTVLAEREDIFLHYPRHTVKTYIKMLEEAVNDPEVISVKITLYRLGEDSQIINCLCRLAEMEKDVTAVVELKARFDEENNINWSKRLEEAGCKVIYGVDGYKIHSKITLITKRHGSEIKYITHLATGNYNEKTAKLYTDAGIITSNEKIGKDAQNFFNSITTSEPAEDYSCLLVAPLRFKSEIIKLIREEAEKAKSKKSGLIKLKMNSLTDREIIEELVEASKAGVKINLLIRGICCLLPGIAENTENIKIISVVGRFLEHSRIFIFGEKNHETGEKNKIYISSADLMTRNTSRRIEIAAPVFDEGIKAELESIFDIYFCDNIKARELCPNGSYKKIETDQKFDAQNKLFIDGK